MVQAGLGEVAQQSYEYERAQTKNVQHHLTYIICAIIFVMYGTITVQRIGLYYSRMYII